MNARLVSRALALLAAAALSLGSVGAVAAHAPGDGGHIPENLWITKTAWEPKNQSGIFEPGNEIGFTIEVGGYASNGTVTDALPSGFTWYVKSEADDYVDLECGIDGPWYGSQSLECSFDWVEGNDDITIWVSGWPNDYDENEDEIAPPCGTITNTATVQAVNGYYYDRPIRLAVPQDYLATDSDTDSLSISGCPTSVQIPAISVTKTPSAASVNAGGSVTYSYAVTNTSIDALLTGISVSDDKCAPVAYTGGDADSDGNLQIGETWTYACTTTLSATTTNVATATGHWRTQTVTANASATVTVGAAPTEEVLAETGRPGLTLPPTSTAMDDGSGSAAPSLALILLALGGIAALAGLAAPARARNRR